MHMQPDPSPLIADPARCQYNGVMNRRSRLPAFLIDIAYVFCILTLVLALAFTGSGLLAVFVVAIPLVPLLLPSFFPRFPVFVPVRASSRRHTPRAPPRI
jgi:hypothetical protein